MAIWSKNSDKSSTPPAPESAPAAAAVPPQAAAAPGAAPAAAPAELPPEALKNGAAVSKAVMAAFGEIVTVLMRTQEHRNRPLHELESLAVPAVITGQFAVAEAQSKTNGMMAPVGLILWARVTPEIDQRLRANIAQGLQLAPQEWRSGDIVWIMEAVGDPKILNAMLQRATQNEWKGRAVHLRVRAQDGSAHAGVLTAKPTEPQASA